MIIVRRTIPFERRSTMATTDSDNVALTSRVHKEIIEDGNVDLVDELYTEDAVVHGAPGGDLRGHDAIRQHFESTMAALTPLDVTEELAISDDEFVTVRRTDTYRHDGELLGIEPSGEEVTCTVNVIARFEDATVAEVWLASPMFDLSVQLGVVDPPTG